MQTSYANRSQRRNVRPSVCKSVCHTPLRYCMERRKLASCFFTIREPEHSSFWKYLGHHEIRKGSPRARAIYETGVKMAILTIFLPINRRRPISKTVQNSISIGTKINDPGWSWIDLERLLCAPLHYTRLSEPTTKIWMKIEPPSTTKM